MSDIYGIDYETYWISNESPIPKPVCLSYAKLAQSGPDEEKLLVGKEQIEPFLRERLQKNDLLIAHNATFEMLVTYIHFPALRKLVIRHLENGKFFCTQLYQQLIDNLNQKPLYDHSLAGLVLVYLKKDIAEDKKNPNAWRMRYNELDGIPLKEWPKEAIDYAINDSIYALRVYQHQMAINKNIEFKEHLKASFALNLMADRGLLIDKERVAQLECEILNYLNPIYKTLEKDGFVRLQKNGYAKNVKVLREYIKTNFKAHMKTRKGDIAVSGEALDFYSLEKQDDIVDSFRNLSKFEKAKSAFVSRLKTAAPLIRTNYNAIVRTGRTSSRATTAYPSVNIQQQPRELKGVTWNIRNCYIPRPGYKLVTIDYNNLELLSCAHQLYSFYGESKMRDIINSGTKPTDLHSVFACELMSSDTKKRITYDEFVAHKKDEGYKDYRQKGKPVTLGVPGGMGFDTIRTQFNKEGIKLPFKVLQPCQYEVVARRLIKKYKESFPYIRVKRTGKHEWSLVFDEIVKLKGILFKLYPELEMFLKEGHKEFLNGESGWVKNEFNEWEEEPYYKYRTLGVQRDYCTYTAFCNAYLMQGPSAVGAKKAVWDSVIASIDNDEIFPLAFIHDELVYEIKDNENLQSNVDKCAEIMIAAMKTVLTSVRIAVEAEIKDYWSKDVCLSSRNYWKDYASETLCWS